MFNVPEVLHKVGNALTHAFLPPTCALCGRIIEEGEWVCGDCAATLEPLHLCASLVDTDAADNALSRMFWGRLPVEKAMSLLRYHVDSPVADLLQQMKYHKRPRLTRQIGRWMARELMRSGIFEGVDALVPMPLTPSRQRERGYNQSERLARGISDVTGIPVRADVVERVSFQVSQTRLMGDERRLNVLGSMRRTAIYEAECLRGAGLRHPLLVDDVITTGASISALAEALSPPCVSILSLALAGVPMLPHLTDEQITREMDASVTRAHVKYKGEGEPMIITLLPSEDSEVMTEQSKL